MVTKAKTKGPKVKTLEVQKQTRRKMLAAAKTPVSRRRKNKVPMRHNPCMGNIDRSDRTKKLVRAEPRCAGQTDPITFDDIFVDEAVCDGTQCASVRTMQRMARLGARSATGDTSQPVPFDVFDAARNNKAWDSKKQAFRNGRGMVTNSDGSTYDGEWRDGKWHGRGKMTGKDGSTYEGEFRDNKRHGRGKLQLTLTGSTYEGEFRDNKRHGRGKLHYTPDEFSLQQRTHGQSYDGEWLDDKRHGQGKSTWADGRVYEGTYKHGQKENGVLTYRYGRTVTIGDGKLTP